MNKEFMAEEYLIYPFKIRLLIGRFDPQVLVISGDDEEVTIEIIDKKTSDPISVVLKADEMDVLITSLSLFKKRIERKMPTVTSS